MGRGRRGGHHVGEGEEAEGVVLGPVDGGHGDGDGAQVRLVHQRLHQVLQEGGTITHRHPRIHGCSGEEMGGVTEARDV